MIQRISIHILNFKFCVAIPFLNMVIFAFRICVLLPWYIQKLQLFLLRAKFQYLLLIRNQQFSITMHRKMMVSLSHSAYRWQICMYLNKKQQEQ